MDAFKVLGIEYDASEAEVKKAYRRLAKKFHPDIQGGDQEQFLRISQAYEKLKGWAPKEYAQSNSDNSFAYQAAYTETSPKSSFKRYNKTSQHKEVVFKPQHSFNNHLCMIIFTLGAFFAVGGYIILKDQYIGIAGISLTFISAMMKVYSSIIDSKNELEI